MQLDCNACKSPSSMVATKVARFSGVIRAIGVLLLIPSFLGFAIAALFFITSVIATANVMPSAQSEPEQAGAAIGFVIGFGFSIFIRWWTAWMAPLIKSKSLQMPSLRLHH